MTVKKILLKSTYRIQNIDYSQLNNFGGNDSDNLFQQYRDLQDFSISTCKENLLGDWELIELTGDFCDLSSSFIHTMIQTHRIWKENWPCDILYVDADIICLNECDFFTVDHSPSSAMMLPFFWNCGVRYFPYTMPHSQWKIMYDNISNWNYQLYDYEQETYKAMHSGVSHTGMGGEYQDERFIFNVVSLELKEFDPVHAEARMIHAHASKGPTESLKFLKQLWSSYGPPARNNS